MIDAVIRLSIQHRFAVLICGAALAAAGLYAFQKTPLDALPDLSDVQVIVVSEVSGQSPDVVEGQVTYPLTTSLLATPGARVIRGYSYFGLSMVYVIFEDGTDLYWARSRVLEALSVASARLPPGVVPQLGPDASGVGWVYQYALVDYGPFAEHLRTRLDADGSGEVDQDEAAPGRDATELRALFRGVRGLSNDEIVAFTLDAFDEDGDGRLAAGELAAAGNFPGVDLAELRRLQDWFLRYELSAIPGVAEVASVGGFVQQFQVEVDPDRLNAYGLSLSRVKDAIRRSNLDVGGRLIELAETELMVRGLGYVEGVDDLKAVALGVDEQHVPIMLRDVAHVQVGPELRRGLVDFHGLGDTASGIVVMRHAANAMDVIGRVKGRLEELSASLPAGVRVVPVYDRSGLIERARSSLSSKLVAELIIVAVVCMLFLLHVRSAFVAIAALPLGVVCALGLSYAFGVSANIMSLGGIAIAIGVMVDASVVMVENAHKHLARSPGRNRLEVLAESCHEVGPALFFSLLIITVSFLPVFALQAQEGRLFTPLALTKTFAMGSACLLAVTFVPAMTAVFVRGRIPAEAENPISRFCIALYGPVVDVILARPRATLAVAGIVLVATLYPLSQLGSEFMPPLDEGDLLYMPTTLPGISITKAKEVLQQTDRIIATFPEVERVFGKVGRAETATDPAPLSMIETIILLEKDKRRWRKKNVDRWYTPWAPEGLKRLLRRAWPDTVPLTTADLVSELNRAVRIPGLTNAWTMPIKTRVDMLATGIKTPVGIKILGNDLEVIETVGRRIEAALEDLPGTLSVYSERATGGNYLDFRIDRAEVARYGLTVGAVQDVIQSAIGGMNVSTAVDGPARIPINVRYTRELRSDLAALRRILVATPMGHSVPLGQLARIDFTRGPPMIKSENARRTAWVYVDLAGVDVGSYVQAAKEAVGANVSLPPGVSIVWSGQYAYLARAQERLTFLIPLTLVLVFALLYLHFRNMQDCLLVLSTLPFGLVGGVWLMWALDFDLSVAVAVGFIALAGLAAETGVVMLVYLEEALQDRVAAGSLDEAGLLSAVRDGAVERLRPKLMTVSTTFLGLLPVMIGTGTGSEVMKRIAAPMVGGLASSAALTLLVLPAAYLLLARRRAVFEGARPRPYTDIASDPP